MHCTGFRVMEKPEELLTAESILHISTVRRCKTFKMFTVVEHDYSAVRFDFCIQMENAR